MKKSLILSIMLLTGLVAKSQNYNIFFYSYDNAGNRTQRTWYSFKILNKATDSTQSKIDSTYFANSNDADKENSNKLETTLGLQKITIYPNPAKNELKIEITNMNADSKGTITVTDMQGRIVHEHGISQYKFAVFSYADYQ